MSHPYFIPFRTLCILAFSFTSVALPASSFAAVPASNPAANASKLPSIIKEPNSPKASAYYHFSLGEMYEGLAETYGNRSDYVNKAIENYRLAMKEDPSASFLVEDIAELYRISGRLREAVEEAQDALKANPNDLNARRVLAHIYTQQIGDPQTNRIDEGMAKKAIEQYKLITDQDPKDVDSLIMLGRLYRVMSNSVDAEAAFKKVLAIDPENEEAMTGLASLYSERGDPKTASELLEKLTRDNPSPRALMLLATDYEQMQQFAQAAEAYRKALQLDPSRTELKAALAEDEARAGNFNEALKTYQELADSNPQDAQPYYGMSQIYRQQRNFDMAKKMNDKAKELDPENPDIQFNEVTILEDQGKTNEAIAALRSLLEDTARRNYAPNERSYRAKLLEQLGVLYRNNDQYDQAVDSFRQIATLDPDLGAHAEAQVVDTYRLARNFPKADEESAAAAKKYPNDRTLREVRAQLLADEGKTDLAIAELKTLLNGKDDREVYLAMADTYQRAHQYSKMAPPLDSAEKLSTSNSARAAVLFMRGAMYERQKQYDLAEKTFRDVLAIDAKTDPTYASALNYLGYMLADRNVRLDEAEKLIEQAVQLDPNNYAYLDSLGWVYYRLNRLPEAERELTLSVKLYPKDPTIHDHLGDIYFKQGKIQQAITQWQSSLQEMNAGSTADLEPDEMSRVQKKLDNARVRLAKEQTPSVNKPR